MICYVLRGLLRDRCSAAVYTDSFWVVAVTSQLSYLLVERAASQYRAPLSTLRLSPVRPSGLNFCLGFASMKLSLTARMPPASWSPHENLSFSRRINICCQCIASFCLRADGVGCAPCCRPDTHNDTLTTKCVRMGRADIQQWSPILHCVKASVFLRQVPPCPMRRGSEDIGV